VDEYGAAETGVIAFECPQGGLHIMADCVYVEFLDEFDQPAIPGTRGRIVVTNLHNYSMPLLRYDIGDSGVASGSVCQCGRGLPLMESLKGRTVDELVTADGERIHPDFFYATMGHLTQERLAIRQYKIYQVAFDQLKIEIVKGPDFSDDVLKYIDRTLRQFLGPEMNIRYEFVSAIPRERSGKLRYFVSLLNTG
jgi:phenylacetate-CoA ligase